MSILVTNDDGIDSPYLEALASRLDSELDDEVVVIAPEKQRSATSHTITLHKPLRVREVAPRRFSASGTPVDCVYIGLVSLVPKPVRLVVSGINDGHNLGTDVFYSGTVGGAVEGGLRGIPSIAASLAPRSSDLVDRAASLVSRVAASMLGGAHDGVLNINVPAGWNGQVRFTRLGRRFYHDDVHERTDPRGRTYYWIGGGIAGACETPGTDGEAIRDGIASITPMAIELSAGIDPAGLAMDLGEFELA